MVYYFDTDAVEAEGILEQELLESLEEAGEHGDIEHIEFSLVSEVVQWLKDSQAKVI